MSAEQACHSTLDSKLESSSTTPWPDTGDNAWQLTAASLVALMSVPDLAVLYAGITKTKWTINSAFMAFYAFAAVLICRVLWAYNMGFGTQMLPLVARPGSVVTVTQELSQSMLPAAGISQNFALGTMIYFRFVFAAITLMTTRGSFLGRMNPRTWMLFVLLWLTFSHTISAFPLRGGGYSFQMGVIDYSGGYVIHLSFDAAGFVGAYWIGPHLAKDREEARPNNILCVLIGAGIPWTGWSGLNGGDTYAASAYTGVAVLSTNICAVMNLLTGTVWDMIYFKEPSVIGVAQDVSTGLVAITPAAGVVAGWSAICLGFVSGIISRLSINIMGKKVAYFRKIDETLGVFHTHTHGFAGFVGGFGTGLFTTVERCAAFGITNPGGTIAVNGKQVWLQLVGELPSSGGTSCGHLSSWYLPNTHFESVGNIRGGYAEAR